MSRRSWSRMGLLGDDHLRVEGVCYFLRRRFAQKPDEDEGLGIFALTISWSSASRLLRSRYPFSPTSSSSSTVASLIPNPSTVPPLHRTWLSAIPHTRRPVRRWSLGTSQPTIVTEALPIATPRGPKPRRCGSSSRPGMTACSGCWGCPASRRPCVRARSAQPSSAVFPDRRGRSARCTCAASMNVTTRSATRLWNGGSREVPTRERLLPC
jgi:hypothetical protein